MIYLVDNFIHCFEPPGPGGYILNGEWVKYFVLSRIGMKYTPVKFNEKTILILFSNAWTLPI
jgi:hypothetical protein